MTIFNDDWDAKQMPVSDPYVQTSWYTDEEWIAHEKTLAPKKIPQPKPQPKTTTVVKSKMCKNVLNGRRCTLRTCTYAHFVNELVPDACSFTRNCRYKDTTCMFIHVKESMEEFKQRILNNIK